MCDATEVTQDSCSSVKQGKLQATDLQATDSRVLTWHEGAAKQRLEPCTLVSSRTAFMLQGNTAEWAAF